MVLFCKPRVCGEKSRVCPRSDPGTESPPRMRGKGSFVLLLGELIRITPACAGKRRSSPGRASGRGDHPRMCGEKMMKAGSNCAMLGSPPRMRGKVRSAATGDQTEGITPAYAGKRKRKTGLRRQTQDHPRVCGEKKLLNHSDPSISGSPPRMRGKEARLAVL